ANASDNVAVAGVQFKLDGANLGAEDTSSPYSVSWTTTTVANGTHTLTAVARDAAGNTATATSVTVTVSNAAPTGLVAAYGFNEGTGTTTADASGNGNTGTLSNATWVTSGKYGGALQFDGSLTSLVNVPDATSLHLTSGMTLEAWVNPSSLSSPDSGWCAVVAKEHRNSSNDIAYALYAANGTGTPAAGHILVGTDRGAQGTSVLPLNTWSFLTATYNGSTLIVYVNGVQVGSRSVSGNIVSTTDPLRIRRDWSADTFTG